MELFDNFGCAMIDILIFFFVFLISGISLLQERTTDTLERLLSTSIKRWETVDEYVLDFDVITMVQSSLIALYAVYILGLIILVDAAFLYAISHDSLALGPLVPTSANGFHNVVPDFMGLAGLHVGFMILNTLLLKNYRHI